MFESNCIELNKWCVSSVSILFSFFFFFCFPFAIVTGTIALWKTFNSSRSPMNGLQTTAQRNGRTGRSQRSASWINYRIIRRIEASVRRTDRKLGGVLRKCWMFTGLNRGESHQPSVLNLEQSLRFRPESLAGGWWLLVWPRGTHVRPRTLTLGNPREPAGTRRQPSGSFTSAVAAERKQPRPSVSLCWKQTRLWWSSSRQLNVKYGRYFHFWTMWIITCHQMMEGLFGNFNFRHPIFAIRFGGFHRRWFLIWWYKEIIDVAGFSLGRWHSKPIALSLEGSRRRGMESDVNRLIFYFASEFIPFRVRCLCSTGALTNQSVSFLIISRFFCFVRWSSCPSPVAPSLFR